MTPCGVTRSCSFNKVRWAFVDFVHWFLFCFSWFRNGTWPLPKSMLIYFHLDAYEQTFKKSHQDHFLLMQIAFNHPGAESFWENSNTYLYLISSPNTEMMAGVVEILPRRWCYLLQYHRFLCPGDTRSLRINSHGVIQVLPGYSGFSTPRVSCSNL